MTFVSLLRAISIWTAMGVAKSSWQMIPRKLSLYMPVACSKIRISLSWVIWGTLGEIYNVIIPTVKKIQVKNQWIFFQAPVSILKLLKFCQGAIKKVQNMVHNKYITTLNINITVYINLVASNHVKLENNNTLFFIRIYFITISRLKFAKFFKNNLRINPMLKLWKEYNFVCWRYVITTQLCVFT